MKCPDCDLVMVEMNTKARCPGCGHLTTCCEGAPLPVKRVQELRRSGAAGPHQDGRRKSRSESRRRAIKEQREE